MTKIIRLEASNVMRLKAAALDVDGTMNKIGGENGSGKSSLLNAIAMALGGGDEFSEVPVSSGEKRAKVELKLSDGTTITRTITANGTTKLEITNADNFAAKSPQALLDSLTGKRMFDPFTFTRLDAAKQRETLLKLLGLDFKSVDADILAKTSERLLQGRTRDSLKVRLDMAPKHEGIPEEPIDTMELINKQTAATKHNKQLVTLEKAYVTADENEMDCGLSVSTHKARIAEYEQKVIDEKKALEEAQKNLVAFQKARGLAKKAVEDFNPVDVEPITKALSESGDTNRKIAENAARKKLFVEWSMADTAYTNQTDAIDELKLKKDAALAKAKFPIDGLGFSDSGVLFKGLPFAQASTAEQIRASVAIGAALNPKLPVMLVRDGSLLDKKSMALLAELAREKNLQLFIEVAGDGKGCTIIVEDGVASEVEKPLKELVEELGGTVTSDREHNNPDEMPGV